MSQFSSIFSQPNFFGTPFGSAAGASIPALGSLFLGPAGGTALSGILQSLQLGIENERLNNFKTAFAKEAEGLQGQIMGGPGAPSTFSPEEVEDMIRGLSPGQAGLGAFQAGLSKIQLPSSDFSPLAGAIGALGRGAQQQITGARGDVTQAFQGAQAGLRAGMTPDTLALGQRINALSGLDEMFGSFTPAAALSQAAGGARAQQSLIGQAAGALPESQAARQGAIEESGLRFGQLGLQAADQARARNAAIAEARGGILTQTGGLLEQLNAARQGQIANLGAGLGQELSGLGVAGAQLQQSMANPLLALGEMGQRSQMFGADLQSRLLTELASRTGEAASDPARQIEFALSTQANQQALAANPALAWLGVLQGMLSGAPTPYLASYPDFAASLYNAQSQKHAQDAASESWLKFGF